MNCGRREMGELGNVPAYVVAVWIEPHCLSPRIEDTSRPWVRSGARDPLPVPNVARDVAIDDQLGEDVGAEAPVEAQCPGEEGAHDEARAIARAQARGRVLGEQSRSAR
jgi:hypothetical protein